MFLLAIALQGASPASEELFLVCDGGTAANATTSTTNAIVRDQYGNEVSGTASTSEPTNVNFRVQFRMLNGAAEMNVPTVATPQLRGGQAGWFPVKKLVVSDTEISGNVSYNFMSSSRFRIDRRTGIMTSSGGFNGTCVKRDLSQRAF